MHESIATVPANSALAAGVFSNLDVAQIASFAQFILPVLEKKATDSANPWDDVLFVAASELITSQRFLAAVQKAVDSTKKPA